MKPTYDFSWMCCLVIDDSHSVSDYLGAILKESLRLKEVHVSYSALDALEILEKNPHIHVVLSDLNMEGIDGLGMIRQLKEKCFRGYLGIISSMSAKVLNSSVELAKAHNINVLGSVPKPISEDALIKLLSGVGNKTSSNHAPSNNKSLKIYELIRGIEKEQFEIYYQPKIDIHTRSIMGVEALTRLHHPRLGIIPPDQFIEAMERTALISSLTEYVLKRALNFLKRCKAEGHELSVAVNISPQELDNLEFPDKVMTLLEENDIAPRLLTLEITESALNLQQANALEVLNRLSMKGVKLSIDDFGTGHSSLERLRIYPFDELKIDKSFMLNAKDDDRNRSIVESSVVMAKRLGLQVVFEGIENASLYQVTDHLGGDIIQGYHIAKPLRDSEVIPWITDWMTKNS